ncbi:MAG: thiamine pyrophosphate-binding protein [bacterium]|nr:thiamine pyrophosphate-binding protein [bacterium]
MTTVSEIFVEELKSVGVETVFGIPSIHNIALYNVLREESAIKHILCRHEASATHMADGYARTGNGVGVVITSTGPGAAYSISPLLEAWCSCSPVLMITSNIASNQIGQRLGVLHELDDQDALFKNITKAAFCIRNPDDAVGVVEKAAATALSGRQGPVYIEVPVDIWDEKVTMDRASEKPQGKSPMPDLAEVTRLLEKAKQPVIVAGVEAVRAGLSPLIVQLAEAVGAPVVTDFEGKGIVPENNAYSFGCLTYRGMGFKAFATSDLTLAIGSRLRSMDFGRPDTKLNKLVHIDWDDTWIDKNLQAGIKLVGDVNDIVALLKDQVMERAIPEERKEWAADLRKRHEQEMIVALEDHPEAKYLDVLRGVIPRDGRLLVDNTILGYLTRTFYKTYITGGLIPANGSTPIGFSFPAAIGAKVANPDQPVVALIGDGGFLYGAQELATCMRHGIGFPIIVVNDSTFRMIDILQQRTYQEGYETNLVNPDFSAFARSFGASAIQVDSPDGLGEAVESALKSKKMCLIEVAASFPGQIFRFKRK